LKYVIIRNSANTLFGHIYKWNVRLCRLYLPLWSW